MYLTDSMVVMLIQILGVYGRRFKRHRERLVGKKQVQCRKPTKSPGRDSGRAAYTRSVVQVYKRETREVIRRFRTHRLSFPNTIAALDAALAGVLPRLEPEQLEEVRAAMLLNNATVMEEMMRRNTRKPH